MTRTDQPDGHGALNPDDVTSINLPAPVASTSVPGIRFNPLTREPVRTVFIHGVLASPAMWKGVTGGRIARSAAALPLPGHFPWAVGPAAVDALVDDFAFLSLYRDWIAREAAGPVHIVAHSAGTVVALKFAALYPEHVARLTLIGAFADGRTAATASTMARSVALPVLGGPLFQRLHSLWLTSTGWFDAGLASAKMPNAARGTLSRAERSMLSDLRRSDPESLRRVVLWLQRTTVEPDLAAIKAPVTLLVAQNDPVVSLDKQMALLKRLDNANAVISHVGHLPMFESADLVRRLIEAEVPDQTTGGGG